MLTVEDYEDFVERLAEGLGCEAKLPEVAAAIGTLRAKADEREELAQRVAQDVQVISAFLPTAEELEDVRRGVEDPRHPLAERLDRIRTNLAALRRHVEGLK